MEVKIIECPRDAMQGLKNFIPTDVKIKYINQLLKVGFDTIDFGSFVSPKAIPQLRDTSEVLSRLDIKGSKSKLLAIVANRRGAEEAAKYKEISYLGFPFSISETFQQRNTNSSIEESLVRVEEIQNLCIKNNKEMVAYISMGFGNPYGDEWSSDIAIRWVNKLSEMGIRIIQLSDTIGVAQPDSISYLFSHLVPEFSEIEFGGHFHSTADSWREKVEAAYNNGCLRFDGAIRGYGGCPMAKDDLTGNMATENLLYYFDELGVDLGLDISKFLSAEEMSLEVFGAG